MFQGTIVAASAHAAEAESRLSGELSTSGTTWGTAPSACWSAATSPSHFVKKPATSMLKAAVRGHVRVDDDAGQRVERELARPALDGHVPEALEGEVRLVHLLPAALEDVGDPLLRRAQVGGVEGAGLVE